MSTKDEPCSVADCRWPMPVAGFLRRQAARAPQPKPAPPPRSVVAPRMTGTR